MTYQEIKVKLRYLIFMMFIISNFLLIVGQIIPNLILNTLNVFLVIYYYKLSKIKETTLCLIVKNDLVLMMYRNKKDNDVHINKYNGLGGRVEVGESKQRCVLREVHEEAGIILTDYRFVGKVVFKNFGYKKGKEVMYCYVAYDYDHEISECNEGELQWIHKDEVLSLPLWEGDPYFIMKIINNEAFEGYLHYKDDHVVDYKITGR